MKARAILLSLMSDGMLIGTLLAFAYTLTAYRIVSGLTLKEITYSYYDNTLLYFAITFYMLWGISVFFYYTPSKICEKYGVDVIK